MSADKSKVLNILEMRYDYMSSRNVLNNWRKAAGIREDSDSLNDEALKSLLAYLKENAADAVRVHGAIERMILAKDTPEEAPAVVEEVKAEEAPAEEAKAEEAPAEEVKAEEAPAEGGKKKKKAKH